MEEQPVLSGWYNRDNQLCFYEKPPIKSILQGYSEMGGLEAGCDVDAVYELLDPAAPLLEVGSGYGRVVNRLLQRNYPGVIDMVEKSAILCKELALMVPNGRLFHTDIMHFTPPYPYHTILSMWSGISDFAKEEQLLWMGKLASLLAPGGRLIMDTSLCHQKPINARLSDHQYYLISKDDCTVRGYIPSATEVTDYARQTGLVLEKQFIYLTPASRQRMMYVLVKPKTGVND